jgi:hypothetical protein
MSANGGSSKGRTLWLDPTGRSSWLTAAVLLDAQLPGVFWSNDGMLALVLAASRQPAAAPMAVRVSSRCRSAPS